MKNTTQEQFTFNVFKQVNYLKLFNPKTETTIVYEDKTGLGLPKDFVKQLEVKIDTHALLLNKVKGVL